MFYQMSENRTYVSIEVHRETICRVFRMTLIRCLTKSLEYRTYVSAEVHIKTSHQFSGMALTRCLVVAMTEKGRFGIGIPV